MLCFILLLRLTFKIGDAFVLCDAGGGTVDLISYEISRLDPLELRELVPGTGRTMLPMRVFLPELTRFIGGLAGSLMVNRRFEEAIKDAVGEEQYTRLRKHKSYRIAMQFFDESVKPKFSPYEQAEDEMYYVNFPMAGLQDDPSNNVESNCFNVTK